MPLFVGLGNPGRRYEGTRHNIGFQVLEAFAKRHGLQVKEHPLFQSRTGRGLAKEVAVHLILPETYMNNSGVAVRKYLDYYGLKACDVVVVHDEADVDFQVVRLKKGGGSGGHNGLKSLQGHLGTGDFIRVRMGIGHPRTLSPEQGQIELEHYVLSGFTAEEKGRLPTFIQEGVEVLDKLLKRPLEEVMNEVNKKRNQQDDKKETRPL